MHKILLPAALLAALLAPFVPAAAPAADSGVMAVINRAISAFNTGDAKAWAATCTSPAAIIDDFPPHSWQGLDACARWWTAWGADAKKNGDTDAVVTLGTPRLVSVTGERAYAVFPATYAYKQHGKPVTQTGAVFTFALGKTGAGWLITSWAWSDGRP